MKMYQVWGLFGEEPISYGEIEADSRESAASLLCEELTSDLEVDHLLVKGEDEDDLVVGLKANPR